MREIEYRVVLAVLVSVMFTIGAQVLVAGATRESVIESPQNPPDNRVLSFGDGRFFIDPKSPKGFTEFEYLYLEGGSLKLAPDKKRVITTLPVSLKGEVQGPRRRVYKLKKAAMENDSLTFESVAIAGVSFQFSGTVLSAGPNDWDFVKIEGRLLKLLNGKRVAETPVTLVWLEPAD